MDKGQPSPAVVVAGRLAELGVTHLRIQPRGRPMMEVEARVTNLPGLIERLVRECGALVLVAAAPPVRVEVDDRGARWEPNGPGS